MSARSSSMVRCSIGVGAAHIYSNLARDIYQAKQVETVARYEKAYFGASSLRMRHKSSCAPASRMPRINLKNVRLMLKQGILSEYDELRASVGVENLRPMVIQSGDERTSCSRQPPQHGRRFQQGRIHTHRWLTFQPVDDALIQRSEQLVLELNPGLSAVRRQIELNGAAVNAERSNYLPTIAAFGQYQYQSAKNEFNFSTKDFTRAQPSNLSQYESLPGMQTYSRSNRPVGAPKERRTAG